MKIARIASAAVIAALALASVASCDRTAKVDTGAVPAVLPVQRDSVASVSGPGSIAIVLDAPADTNTMLSKAIGEFVSESLGGTWEGSCTDFDGMLNHYVAVLASTYTEMFSEGLDDSDCLDNTSIVKYAENENYVSYFITHDLYLGGAHGSQMYSGATFRKADGRRIGWDVFTGKYDDNFANLLKNGLKQYWKIESDNELKSYFLDENDYYSVPLPECAPVFTADGVMFVYNEYELAAYAYGRPSFTLPYSQIEDYMMVTARRLL